MSRFAWIWYSYIVLVSVLIAGNTASFILDKPVQALGILTRWWFIASVFVFTYVSEWVVIVMEKQ